MRILLTACLALTALFTNAALAQQWPTKPVHLIVPYPPGGNVDSAARILGNKLQETTGQPFIVENKAGAGGLVAGEYFKKADPDGYTLFIGANGPVLYAPLIAGRAAYNWRTDFIPITTVSMTPLVLEVNPSVPAKNFAEFLALVRKVLVFHIRDGLVENGKIDTAALDPIARIAGPRYARLGDIVTMKSVFQTPKSVPQT